MTNTHSTGVIVLIAEALAGCGRHPQMFGVMRSSIALSQLGCAGCGGDAESSSMAGPSAPTAALVGTPGNMGRRQ